MSETQLRIGMIGVAGRGRLWRHWESRQGRSVVVAGADVNPDHREAFRREHGGNPFIADDFRELLARPDVDAVAVTSPDYCHEEHAVAAGVCAAHSLRHGGIPVEVPTTTA
jgi:predicted dehydrogenase